MKESEALGLGNLAVTRHLGGSSRKQKEKEKDKICPPRQGRSQPSQGEITKTACLAPSSGGLQTDTTYFENFAKLKREFLYGWQLLACFQSRSPFSSSLLWEFWGIQEIGGTLTSLLKPLYHSPEHPLFPIFCKLAPFSPRASYAMAEHCISLLTF